jgi:hypothetical protein
VNAIGLNDDTVLLKIGVGERAPSKHSEKADVHLVQVDELELEGYDPTAHKRQELDPATITNDLLSKEITREIKIRSIIPMTEE